MPDEPERIVKQVIVIRSDLKMRRGKEIAQGAHAAMAFWTHMLRRLIYQWPGVPMDIPALLTEPEKQWVLGQFTKICCRVDSEASLLHVYHRAVDAGLKVELITDAGKTEFDGVPTHTCIAIGPDYADLIDPVTRDLKLY